MKAEDTVTLTPDHSEGVCCPHCGEEHGIELIVSNRREAQAEISFKAGIKYALSRAVGEGCLSTVNGKHGIHIPDKLYEELSNEAKS